MTTYNPKTFLDLENQICELRHMAAITDQLLDRLFQDVISENPGAAADKVLSLRVYRGDIEEIGFAVGNVLRRAGQLRTDFYAAYEAG
jgi:Asp-tRNA(Asn)/Glu-tRNA(Gln) amidotransferase B subunit